MKGKREGEREKETLERGRQRETLGEGDGGEKNRGRGVEICIRNTFIYFHYFSKSCSENSYSPKFNITKVQLLERKKHKICVWEKPIS